ncbi:MAG: hypothetical protein QOJ64_2643 [Acidobacteriota bacterium]|jgi:succinate-semialdehyde dehydrogenase/glutarate-semialdehyde dehydrogenase|nr:hypothetical protein [Acidobacteriota bacterium]
MSVQTLNFETKQAREIISYNPATGEEVGRAPLTSSEEVSQAIGLARGAQTAWANETYGARAAIVMRARQIILAQLDEIALLISKETGKPVAEAISMELAPTLDLMQFFARRTKALLRTQKIDIGQYGLMGRTSRIVYKPLGVIGIISPWNFPWAIPLGEVVMALMAGNGVVLKPSELTPLTGLKIAGVFKRAGLRSGLLQVVTGDGTTGAALVEAGVDKIMFTGSVATGKRVAQIAAKTLTPVVLELGGKDPMIVLDDAELDTAASAAVWGAFSNSGQACASVERCYVDEKIAPAFLQKIIERTLALKQGIGTSQGIDIGAMSSESQLSIVEEHVADAVAQGARVLAGGSRAKSLSGSFHQPTVLADVDHTMKIMRDETFGPVLPVMTFRTEEEAIRLANDSIFGLTASVWTKDSARGKRIAEQIDAGTVMVNEVLYTHGIAQTPWGGLKQSGLGRTHGRLGLLELVAPQHIHVNRITRLRDLWWFSYTPAADRLFRGFAKRFATGKVLQTSLLLPQMIRRLFGARK